MSNVIAFRAKEVVRANEPSRNRVYCELLGVAELSGACWEWAYELFSIRFGVPPVEDAYATAIQPSVAVARWAAEQHAIFRALPMVAPERLREWDALSDAGWSRVCLGLPVPPREKRRAQA